MTVDLHLFALVEGSTVDREHRWTTVCRSSDSPRNGNHARLGHILQFVRPNVFVAADTVLGQLTIVHDAVDLFRLTITNRRRHFILSEHSTRKVHV